MSGVFINYLALENERRFLLVQSPCRYWSKYQRIFTDPVSLLVITEFCSNVLRNVETTEEPEKNSFKKQWSSGSHDNKCIQGIKFEGKNRRGQRSIVSKVDAGCLVKKTVKLDYSTCLILGRTSFFWEHIVYTIAKQIREAPEYPGFRKYVGRRIWKINRRYFIFQEIWWIRRLEFRSNRFCYLFRSPKQKIETAGCTLNTRENSLPMH